MRLAIITVLLLVAIIAAAILYLTRMPGKSHSGPTDALTSDERTTADALRRHVQAIAGDIGERNLQHYDALNRSADYINAELRSYGYEPRTQPFTVSGKQVENIYVETRGSARPEELVVFGAHYDSVFGTPGANDNASGVAAVLELARLARNQKFDRSVQFVFFVNEEPPYFQTADMGSLVYGKALKQDGRNVVAMLSIETIGFYSDDPESQQYPPEIAALYPSTGNFIAFAANTSSASLLRRVVDTFRRTTQFPSEGGAVPESVPGVGWSDHWSFWQQGYPAVMVTDTAPYRYPHYHLASDTPDKLDYDRTARVTLGLFRVLDDLARH